MASNTETSNIPRESAERDPAINTNDEAEKTHLEDDQGEISEGEGLISVSRAIKIGILFGSYSLTFGAWCRLTARTTTLQSPIYRCREFPQEAGWICI
jgi:hypothetical protein